MEMVPYPFHGGDADWYSSLDNFPPLLCSSSSPPAILSEEDNLPIAVALPGPLGLWNPLLTADSSSSAMILREEESYHHLPMFPAPPAGDPFYFDRLPPLPPDDALMLQPFSDIDLDAFGGVDEHKAAPITDDMAIVPADLRYTAGQDDAKGHGDQKPVGTLANCFHPAAASVGFGDMAVRMPPPRHQVRRSGDRSVQPAGKTRLEHVGFNEIRKYFYMPITKAAREMNVGLTVLKKRCRELGVARWPHRKMKSLRALILNVQEMGKGMSPAAVQRELAALETYCALMEEDPSIELTDRTKKLRQACFKESYKRRRAASVNGVIDHIYNNFGQDHQLTLQEASSSCNDGRSMQSSHFFSY